MVLTEVDKAETTVADEPAVVETKTTTKKTSGVTSKVLGTLATVTGLGAMLGGV